MPAPLVDLLPTPPTLDLPRETFDLAASPFFAAFNPFITQFNTTVQWFNDGNYDAQASGYVVADLAATTIPASVKAFRTGGNASISDGGIADWIEDDFATEALSIAHPLFCKETANSRFVRMSLADGLDMLAAGAVADDTDWPLAGSPTDNGPVFLAALAYMRAMVQAGAPVRRRIFIPSGRYYLGTSTIDVTFTCTIEGDVSEADSDVGGGMGTRLRWTGTSTTGFRFQGYDTYSVDQKSGVGGAPANDGLWSQNSILRNVKLHGGWAGVTEGEGHGVHIRGTTLFENVIAQEWPGDGFYAWASTTDDTHYGNANGSIFLNCRTKYCRNGFYFKGADVNALRFVSCWTFLSRRYGRWHVQGVANVIIGDLAESNGRHYSSIATTCHYGGSWYYCLPNQETGAAANHPKGSVVTFDGTTNKVNWTAHGLTNGTIVSLTNSGGAVPTGLTDSFVTQQGYYVVNAGTNDFQLSLTLGGAAIDFTGNGTGTTTLGVCAANTYWGYLDRGNGGIDVPTWSNGMAIRAGGLARFDGAGQDGEFSCYREQNQAPAQIEAQYVVTGIASTSVDFTGAPYGGWLSMDQGRLNPKGNVLVDGSVTALNGVNLGSVTTNTNQYLYLSTSGSPYACAIYMQEASGTKARIITLSNNLYVDSLSTAFLQINSTTVASWGTNGLLFRGAAGKVGYDTGAGGTVTQATSRTTGVTLNKPCGQITLVSAAGSATWASFTVTNSVVEAGDVVQVSQKSGTDKYMLSVTAVGAGSFQISFATTGGTTTEQPVFSFAVIKAVAA